MYDRGAYQSGVPVTPVGMADGVWWESTSQGWFARPLIVSDPEIRGGEPVLGGTRVPAKIVAGLIADGLTCDEIQGLYPSVTSEHIAALRAVA